MLTQSERNVRQKIIYECLIKAFRKSDERTSVQLSEERGRKRFKRWKARLNRIGDDRVPRTQIRVQENWVSRPPCHTLFFDSNRMSSSWVGDDQRIPSVVYFCSFKGLFCFCFGLWGREQRKGGEVR